MPVRTPDPQREQVLGALLGLQRQSCEQGVLGHALLDLDRPAMLPVLARDAVARQTAAGKPAEIEDVLDDPGTFEEVTAGEMLAYGILTGVAYGWLPGSYAAAGRSLVGTARAHVDGDGLLPPACGAPRFDRPGASAEAQAFFLLATAAQERLAGR